MIVVLSTAPLPPELLDIPDDLLERSASDGTIEENFEEELASAPEVYAEVTFLFLDVRYRSIIDHVVISRNRHS